MLGREMLVPSSFNDDNRVLDVMLLLSLANKYEASLEMPRLMLKRLWLDEQFSELIGYHPLRAVLCRIDTNDREPVSTDLGNARCDYTTWLLQMLSIFGT